MSEQASTETVAERMYELTMRVDRIVHLATCGGEDMDDDVREWLTDDAAAALAPLLGLEDREALEESLTEYGDDDIARREAFGQRLAWLDPDGWLLSASQPVFTRLGESRIKSFSWGHYETRVLSGATYEEALEKAMLWAQANHDAS